MIEAADFPAVLALNNAHAKEMGLLDEAELARLLRVAAHASIVRPAEAFLLALDHTAPAQGPNHAWFLARHPRFFYVDRVCVAPHARKQGLARALYQEAFAAARARELPLVCCEVNLDPPNPISDAFHAALGFASVGSAYLPDRKKTVRYLERNL